MLTKYYLPIREHAVYPDVVAFLQANRDACLESLLADDSALGAAEQRTRVNVLDAIIGALTEEPAICDPE